MLRGGCLVATYVETCVSVQMGGGGGGGITPVSGFRSGPMSFLRDGVRVPQSLVPVLSRRRYPSQACSQG